MRDHDDRVRYNVDMPEQLREDAKSNTEHGELAQEVRDLFRRKAYGTTGAGSDNELEKIRAELQEARHRIDELRHERAKIDAEIESQELRASRLEERVDALQEERQELTSTIDTFENILQNGQHVWPTWVKNNADVDPSTAEKIVRELQDRNPEVPRMAFEEPPVHGGNNWRDTQ